MTGSLIDLLDAITDARVANPSFKPSVQAALRLACATKLIAAGRLLSLRFDGQVREIIVHGTPSQSEDEDLALTYSVRDQHATITRGSITALPLGKGKRVHAVLLLEQLSDAQAGHLLADLFLQWSVMAEVQHLEKAELIDENHQLREELRSQFSDRNLIGVSGAFRRVVDQAHRVAASSATVLIHGETGTGKEMIARIIHDHSPRANAPFIPVNCSALSETLLESELFGHVKGAFTGATSDRKGRFESAHGGTIFLDEIGDVSPGMQTRLLRVLQEMEIERVGDSRTRKLDVRVLAASNRVLEDEVAKGAFRADLYYRLNVVYLHIPPLRNRTEDIPHLVEHFVNQYAHRNIKFITAIAPEVMQAMRQYTWPGNVRELENCVEKMVVMAPTGELTADLLPFAVLAFDPHVSKTATPNESSFETQIAARMQRETMTVIQSGSADLYDRVRATWERHLFEAVLAACDDNKSKAAQVLGITRNTLAARLKELSAIQRTWK
ncbi:MAG: sigma-54 dependent transcriptional regulator [Planctomycetota bacterium]